MTPRSRTMLLRLTLALLFGALTTLTVSCILPLAAREANLFPRNPFGIYFGGTIGGDPPPFEGDLPIITDSITITPRSPSDDHPVPPAPPYWSRDLTGQSQYSQLTTVASGWPFRAMAAEYLIPRGSHEFIHAWSWTIRSDRDPASTIPLRPVPLAFAANTAIFAVPGFALLSLPLLNPAWWRQGRRLRRGLCPACAYDLHWNLAPGCPECGWRRNAPPGRRT